MIRADVRRNRRSDAGTLSRAWVPWTGSTRTPSVRVINNDGELIATFTIDPTKEYQIKNRPGLNP